eukprot:1185958-Prorocentrum_minimum.AAC.2
MTTIQQMSPAELQEVLSGHFWSYCPFLVSRLTVVHGRPQAAHDHPADVAGGAAGGPGERAGGGSGTPVR